MNVSLAPDVSSIIRLALDNIGWTRTERNSYFPMSLTSFSCSCDRNKYGGIWRRSINFFKGCFLCYCDGIYRRVLFFVCSMNQILPHLFLDWKRSSGWLESWEGLLLLTDVSTTCRNRGKEKKEDEYSNSFAKIQVCAMFRAGDIRRNVLLKFIRLCIETPCLCPSEGHKYGGRKLTKTYVIEFSIKSL